VLPILTHPEAAEYFQVKPKSITKHADLRIKMRLKPYNRGPYRANCA